MSDPERRRAEPVMGTVVSLLIPDGGAQAGVADEAFSWFHEVDRRFSPFKPESEVSRFMRGEVAADDASEDLREVLDAATTVELLSDGAFDIRGHRPDRAPDPTGIVKGWSVDRAADILRSGGVERFTLSAGGDVVVHGGREPGMPWSIGVAHPHYADSVALTIRADELAAATSGTTERGSHIVDARTARVATELLTITVVGPRLARADAYATAAFAMGRPGVRWCDALPGYAAAGITADGRLLTTAGMDALLA
jgi:thiamine biosynthesis lipoprotein